MKKILREKLPLSLKLRLKQLVFSSIGAALRLGGRAYNLGLRVGDSAAAHGLDLRRAWDVKAPSRAPFTQQWGVTDFLFLMDVIEGRVPGPPPDRPVRTSVVLLCYNKADLTFQCLRSLVRELDFDDAEVIVVNNASRDETRRMLDRFGTYVRAVHSDTNLGFVHGCNAGASVARGKYVVFLNNDTVVLPGWLENLVETAERDPRVGAVGSMFIYPDGTLQEAGGVVWRDAAAASYGRGQSPEDRRFSFAREVDYCSGASLLVRKDLFDRLGGFDRRYAPIYYEDVDVCMGVRSLGHKVIYQPASRIVHFEGATSGTDTRTGLKRFQLINREKFREKWRGVLEREHRPHDPALAERAANRRWTTQVAVFDDRVPTPDRDAGSARMLFILRALSEWCHPVLVTTSKQVWPEYERQLWKEGVETASALDFRRLMRERRFRAAVVSRPAVAGALLGRIRRADPRVKIVFDMVDAHFIRVGREAALTGDAAVAREAARYRRVETRLARAADLIWCASGEDLRVVAREAPGVPAAVVTTIHRPHEGGPSFDERRDLLFVGNFLHRPNRDGLLFYLREVHPLVRDELPDVRLFVVGDGAPPEVLAHASEEVRVLGYVPDIEPLFRACRVFVAPIRFGAGVKGKVGEALAHGLPVVTTTVGAEGMGITDGEEALVADTPRAFAAAVARAYRERGLWQKLSERGRAHVAKHFTPQVVGEIINGSLRGILKEEAARPGAAGELKCES